MFNQLTLATPAGAARNRPRWRRLRWAVAALLALLSLAAAPAQADDTRLTWSIAPASADGPDGRGSLEYLAEPGTNRNDHVVIRNLGTEPITVELAALDARQTADNPFELLAPDELSSRVGAWIRLDQSRVKVPANDSVVVGFTLDLPDDAEPGDHAGGIVAVSTATSGDGPDVQYRVGTRVYVRVAGPVTAALTAQTEGSFAAGQLLVTPGTLTLTTALANTGNVRLVPSVRAQVTGLFGLWSGTVPLAEVAEVLPGGSVVTTGELAGVPPLGPLRVTLDQPRAQSWGQEIGAEVAVQSATVTVWAAPWAIPLGVVVAIALGLLVWRRSRSRPVRRAAQRPATTDLTPERDRPEPDARPSS